MKILKRFGTLILLIIIVPIFASVGFIELAVFSWAVYPLWWVFTGNYPLKPGELPIFDWMQSLFDKF